MADESKDTKVEPKKARGEDPEPSPHELMMKLHELVTKHAAESKPEHPSVLESVSFRGLASWQREALLARFKAHGLHGDARLPSDVFEKALHEALHGAL